MPIDALPDELMRVVLRGLDGLDLLRAGAACQRLRAVADDNALTTNLWMQLCISCWPETLGLQHVILYKCLWARMSKAEYPHWTLSTPPPVPPMQFMVRVNFEPRSLKQSLGDQWSQYDDPVLDVEERMLIARVFSLNELDEDGDWLCPALPFSDADFKTLFECEDVSSGLSVLLRFSTITVTAFSGDQRVLPVVCKHGSDSWSGRDNFDMYLRQHDTSTELGRIAVGAAFAFGSTLDPLKDPPTPSHLQDPPTSYTDEQLDQRRNGLKMRLGFWRCSDLTNDGQLIDVEPVTSENDDWGAFQDYVEPGLMPEGLNSYMASHAQLIDALVAARGWL